ncbi:TonB-dependent receptor [Paracrocinitomix mangrovi]|uniref:TonB-dependent receptor n=1 Tax=Paracrocinitomix mangrovi TaxID=2862509 RepID=UPI001C8DE3F0|nr:TonB-dependent receptor [Paracrocinitomix mangrovi]UKN03679.1 TonB-dependent receptor [Paracrocinitomix mangrovi]
MKLTSAILLLLLGLTSYTQEFKGQVVNINNGQGIPYAKLHFVDLEIKIIADSTGRWFLQDVPEGLNHLEVIAVGYKELHLDLELIQNKSSLITMQPTHHKLDKVIVSANGYLHRESITNVESRQFTELTTIPTTNLGEALANIPGVYQSSTGNGISKPVIRGLSGSRVVTYINSLRIQNQQWGGDHGLPITSLGIGGVEVIKGPASLLYGADALGGVLYFVDEPFAERNTMSAYISSRFDHNSLGSSNSGGMRFSKDAFKMNIYGSHDNYADFTLPNGKQLLNSRYKQTSAKLAFGYSKKIWVFNLRYNFYNGRIGLPGHTHDSIPTLESFYTDNQNRKDNVPAQRIQNHFISLENKFFFGNQELYITLGNTNNALKEHEEKFFFPDIVMNLNNSLYNVKWRSKLSSKWESIIGSQGMYQMNTNGKDATEILIPDSKTIDAGLYALIRFHKDKWTTMFGGRYDYRQIQTFNPETYTGQFNGLNYSAGFAFTGNKSTVRFNASTGFRAPTSSELLSDGIHHGSYRYEIGDNNLTTEKGTQLDASFALHLDDLELIVNPFYNYIRDYIYLQQEDSIIDNFQVYTYQQASFAQLYGTEFGFHYHPHKAHWVHLETTFSTIFAEDNSKQALPLIPQSRINTQLKLEFEMKKKFKIEDISIQHLYLFKQNRTAVFETETPSYHLLNLAINMKIDWQNPLMISIGVRNILNTTYIDHLSRLKYLGISAPGINGFISLRYEFEKSLKSK